MTKAYLGNSVYVRMTSGGQLVLTTENGLPNDPSNEIFLEPEVYAALAVYAANNGLVVHPGASL